MSNIPKLSNYLDLFDKLEYNIDKFKKSNHIFDLMDCILTFNALPEWIENSEEAPKELVKTARNKLEIMRSDQTIIDDATFGDDINQQLRFIRIFSNQTKHSKKKKDLPKIVQTPGNYIGNSFPLTFHNVIQIGSKQIDASHIIDNLYNFWREKIK